MRTAAADGAGIRCNCAEFQSKSGEDTTVGLVHHIVGSFQTFEVGVERIRVFHQEFAGAHHAETRAHFIAEFGLNLVEIDRQLTIAADFSARDVGDHFFVGRSKAELIVVAVFNFQHLRAEHFPAAGLIP